MRSARLWRRAKIMAASAAVLLPAMVGAGTHALTTAAAGSTRMISSSGTVVFRNTPAGSDSLQNPEIRAQGGEAAGPDPYTGTISGGPGSDGGSANAATARLRVSFDALNHRQNRLASGGNQFSLEPPDQGLCVGNGMVLEPLNDVLRVFDKTGAPLTGPVALNAFLGYPFAVNRGVTPRVFGPFVTDPSCLFDSATQRWFLAVLTLDVNSATGAFTGPNHVDIAVSTTADPTQSWNLYQLAVQDDGTQGTPDHGCSAAADKQGLPTGHGPCIGDYPHIGADANGFYVTTNEYSLRGPEFIGAQVYAFSKHALASGSAAVGVTQFNTHGADAGKNGFTIWPATSPAGGGGGETQNSRNGIEYFMSSNAAGEATDSGDGVEVPHPSHDLLVWALSNTKSLESTNPQLGLSHTVNRVGLYATPPPANQKPGSTPVRDCLNDATCSTNVLLGAPDPFAPEPIYALDSNDTRMQQVMYAHGQLWGALDTALTVKGTNKAGIEWFAVSPSVEDDGVHSEVVNQGYLGLAANNLTYPAIGVTSSGKGVMAFTVVGKDHFPSSGYVAIDADNGTGKVTIAAEGAGPADGFSGYRGFANPPNFAARPRWGDYGAAVPDGNTVWIASEYIGQTCTLAQYLTAPVGSCGGTRTALANWGTRISQVAT